MITPDKLLSSVALFWMIAVLQVTDGGISFTEPAPPYTPASSDMQYVRTTYQRIFKGSTNVSLTWKYSLSGGDVFGGLTWSFDLVDIALKLVTGAAGPRPGFADRFGVSTSEQATLFIFNVTDEDQGKYEIDVATSVGNAPFQWRDIIDVEVIEETKITNVSEDNQTVCEGSSLTLWCNATGRPLPNITWTRVWPNGSDSEVLQHDTVQNFMLSNINRSDSGTYRCTACNGVGNSFNRTVDVSVDYKPENIMFSSNVTGNKVCSAAVVNFTCTADASSLVHTYHLNENDTAVEESSSGVWLMTLSTEGNFSYSCMANNTVGTATSASSLVIVNSAPSVELVHDPMPWIVDEMKNLTCQVSGRPMPDVSWLKKEGAKINGIVWMFSAVTTDDAGEYVCEASNECGSVSKGINVTVQMGRCKENCGNVKECRQFGGEYLCVCLVGKTGQTCETNETPSKTVTTNLRITDEVWMEEYNNLEDPLTKAFTKKFEDTVFNSLRNSGINSVTVTKLWPGSVILEFEATFNNTHGKSEVVALLEQEAQNLNGSLGSYKVDSIGSASPTSIKPGWLALVIIAGVVLLAFVVAIIAFCMQKQKRRGESISMEGQHGKIGENGVSNGRAPETGAGPHARDNIAHDKERYNGGGHERDTPMVTFGHTEPRPEQTPGIMSNDPSATKTEV